MTDRQLLEHLLSARHELGVIVSSYFNASTYEEWQVLYLEAISAKAKADQLRQEAYLRGLAPDSVYLN